MDSKFFEIAESEKLNEIIDRLSNSFITLIENTKIKRQSYYDTFDWRLHRKNLTLYRENKTYFLCSLEDNSKLDFETIKKKIPPLFWNDFPDGRLKEKLKPYLEIRALMPIINIEKNEQNIRILNENKKTVVRASINKIYKFKGSDSALLKNEIQIAEVRGYVKEFNKVDEFLMNSGIGLASQNLISTVLEEEKRKAGDYSGKLNIKLTSEMSASEAAKIIFSNLLETIKQNENGIKKDIDTEFLHDFRVAVRRTRSALSQLKGVFPKRDVEKLKKDFSIIGKKTNKLRDLDVYLLEKNKYMEMLSEDLGAGLEPIFKKLTTERKTEQKKLARFLETDSYKKNLEHFENFLHCENTKDFDSAPNSEKQIIELAKKFIWKKYKQIIEKGRKIDELSPDPILHELRIDCKKLRYLLEFFSSLFPDKEMSIIIKQLKKLQDNLGDFNDLFVQKKSLKNMLDNFNSKGSEIKKVSASVGGLIAVLHQKQKDIRAEFTNCFSELNSEENFKIFSKLFYTVDEAAK